MASALTQQNGTFRDAGGNVVSNAQTQTGGGAISQQTYSSEYDLNGKISRVEPAHYWYRFFFNNGGQVDFSESWQGSKPPLAPVSSQPFIRVPGTDGVFKPAAPAPAQNGPQ